MKNAFCVLLSLVLLLLLISCDMGQNADEQATTQGIMTTQTTETTRFNGHPIIPMTVVEPEDAARRFRWHSEEARKSFEVGYLNRFVQETLPLDESVEQTFAFIMESDRHLAIAVDGKDGKGKEDRYILYLFYSGDDLIAEMVLENTETLIRCDWKKVAEKDENGDYVPLPEATYVTEIKKLIAQKKQGVIMGIHYMNGTFDFLVAVP